MGARPILVIATKLDNESCILGPLNQKRTLELNSISGTRELRIRFYLSRLGGKLFL
jgi:hypothetical protein